MLNLNTPHLQLITMLNPNTPHLHFTSQVVALLKEQVSQLKSTINSILMTQVLDTGLIKTENDLDNFKQIILLQNQEQKSLAEVGEVQFCSL